MRPCRYSETPRPAPSPAAALPAYLLLPITLVCKVAALLAGFGSGVPALPFALAVLLIVEFPFCVTFTVRVSAMLCPLVRVPTFQLTVPA